MIKISLIKDASQKIEDFAQKEWELVDIEHYGKGHHIEKQRYRFIAESKNGEVLGLLDLIIKTNVAYIDGLLVGHEHRKQGVGRKLVEFAESFARDRGCTKIWLDTDEEWAASQVYKKLGYMVTGTHEAHYFGKRALIFAKLF